MRIKRPPVVAILGHVDHGKSSLLDYIRKTNVVSGEAGGITQHVNAYEITHLRQGTPEKITFIDTPGHAAFTGSRKKGARIADIAILIISAEEGVKEQTIESLALIEGIKIPYIVTITKIDKPNANPDKAKQQLAERNIFVEGFGGNIPVVMLSSKTGAGIDELLDIILLMAEIEELSGNPHLPASGFILESHLDPQSGIISTVVIKDGLLTQGMFFITGNTPSKIKRIEDFNGNLVENATFSQPIRIVGLSKLPSGDMTFETCSSKKEAEEKAETPEPLLKKTHFPEEPSGEENQLRAELLLIIKTDVAGTLDAIVGQINAISVENVFIKILRAEIGTITESDIQLIATKKNSMVIGFNVRTDKAAKDMAEGQHIPIHTFDIIYKITEFVTEKALEIKPVIRSEEIIGKAKIIKLFDEVKKKKLIGAQVIDGKIMAGADIKLIRNEHEVGRGKIAEMQIQRIPVKFIEEGTFGALIDSSITPAVGDTIIALEYIER